MVGAEQCDDGNAAAGDGCSGDLPLEAGLRLRRRRASPARAPICGDGVIDGAEACDDGNTDSGDGCSPTAASSRATPARHGAAARPTCGDGLQLVGAEECDDGNTVDRRRLLARLQARAGLALHST